MSCDKIAVIAKGKDKITGEEITTVIYGFIDDQFRVWNKNNSCKYFSKRLFAKNKDKKFCIDCKYWKYQQTGCEC
jgi:hypothetical protein